MEALGIIETKGLLAAIEGADVMLKAADVRLLDKTYVGAGLVSITVTGEVAAVQASVSAAVAALERLDGSELISHHVIPRPDEALGGTLFGSNGGSGRIWYGSDAGDDPAGGSGETACQATPAQPEAAPEGEAVVGGTNAVDSSLEVDTPQRERTEDTAGTIAQSPADAQNAQTGSVPTGKTAETTVLDGTSSVPAAGKTSVTEQKKMATAKSSKAKVATISKEEVDALRAEQGTKKAIAILTRHTLANLRKLAAEYPELPIESKKLSKVKKRMLLEVFTRYYNSLNT